MGTLRIGVHEAIFVCDKIFHLSAHTKFQLGRVSIWYQRFVLDVSLICRCLVPSNLKAGISDKTETDSQLLKTLWAKIATSSGTVINGRLYSSFC